MYVSKSRSIQTSFNSSSKSFHMSVAAGKLVSSSDNVPAPAELLSL